MPCHATCGAVFHFALPSPYLPVPSHAPVFIRSRLFSSFCTPLVAIRLSRACDNLAPSLPHLDFSTYDPLYLPASFTREDPPVRLFPPVSPSSPSPPAPLRRLAFFKALPRWLFFGPKRVLGTVLLPLARAEKWRLERTTCAARQIKDG